MPAVAPKILSPYMFTLQDFPEPIVITQKNSNILHRNCLRCHADLVHAQGGADDRATPRCVRCHASVGHGEPVGLGGPCLGVVC